MSGAFAAVRHFYYHLNDRLAVAINAMDRVIDRFEGRHVDLLLTVLAAYFVFISIRSVKTGRATDLMGFRGTKRSENPLGFWIQVFQVPILLVVCLLITLVIWLHTGGPSPF